MSFPETLSSLKTVCIVEKIKGEKEAGEEKCKTRRDASSNDSLHKDCTRRMAGKRYVIVISSQLVARWRFFHTS